MHRILFATAAVAALLPVDAQACGGFFCRQTPVDQSAERIVFAIDEDAGEVEVQVQISYEGEAPDFAWVLPTPTEPVLEITVDDVFLGLAQATQPQWNLTFETEGTCREAANRGVDLASVAEDADDGGAGGGVEVVASGPLGPYETEILKADDADKLLTYLQGRDYVLPDDLAPKLAPYVASESYFVALRLQNDKDTGDLQPLAVRYAGTEASIPLQLTAIAATDDMRLQPFVLGPHRAVPDSYLHVTVNPFAIDWLSGGANYADVITRAADLAGGQAFATDFAGPTDPLVGTLWAPGRYDVEALRALGTDADGDRIVNAMQFDANIPLSSGTEPFLQEVLPLPDGMAARYDITETQIYGCLDCYDETRTLSGDATALADALETSWVPAMRHAEDLLSDAAWLTRLTSSMDADEMTVDPTFTLNPDMPAVSNVHQATLVAVCGSRGYTFEDAPRKLVLEDGREMWLPPEYLDTDFDYDDYVGTEGAGLAADEVQETSSSGAPVVLASNRAAIDEAVAALPVPPPCGCRTGGAGGFGMLALTGLVALRRRR